MFEVAMAPLRQDLPFDFGSSHLLERLRDMGRVDFRLGEDGRIYFLEVNSLPSLEKGAGILITHSPLTRAFWAYPP